MELEDGKVVRGGGSANKKKACEISYIKNCFKTLRGLELSFGEDAVFLDRNNIYFKTFSVPILKRCERFFVFNPYSKYLVYKVGAKVPFVA